MAQVRTAQTIIKQALRSIGAIATGETPDADTLSEGLDALQDLLSSWAEESMIYYLNEREQITLTASTSYYTLGSGGTVDTTRPVEVVGATYQQSGETIERPVRVIDHAGYRRITQKTTESQSYWLWYNPNYPLGEMRLYPTPDAADTLYLDSIKPLTEPSALTSNLNFPEGYNRAIRFNLALDLAPEYGHPLTAELIKAAEESKANLLRKIAKWEATQAVIEVSDRGVTRDTILHYE